MSAYTGMHLKIIYIWLKLREQEKLRKKKKNCNWVKTPPLSQNKNKQEDKLKNSDWVSLKESQSIFFFNFEIDIFNFTDFFFFFPKR